MKRNGRNILRQGAAVAMAILLAMPALPARAAEVGKGTEGVFIASEMALSAMAVGARLDAAGNVIPEILTDTGDTNGQQTISTEIVGGG